jgi:hypothetical protein
MSTHGLQGCLRTYMKPLHVLDEPLRGTSCIGAWIVKLRSFEISAKKNKCQRSWNFMNFSTLTTHFDAGLPPDPPLREDILDTC